MFCFAFSLTRNDTFLHGIYIRLPQYSLHGNEYVVTISLCMNLFVLSGLSTNIPFGFFFCFFFFEHQTSARAHSRCALQDTHWVVYGFWTVCELCFCRLFFAVQISFYFLAISLLCGEHCCWTRSIGTFLIIFPLFVCEMRDALCFDWLLYVLWTGIF